MADKILQSRLMLCSKTSTEWANNSTIVLKKGEIGLESNTKKFKVGDGASEWAALDYWYGTDNNDNTHYTTKLILGDSDDTADATSSVSNPYIRLFDDNTFRSDIQFKGGTALSATGVNGVVTYNHLTSEGYKHIPSGGTKNTQILRWSSAGTAVWSEEKDTTYTVTEGDNGHSFTLTPSSGTATTITFGSAAAKEVASSVTSGGDGLPTAGQVYSYVQSFVGNIVGGIDAMTFKGTVGTGGTVTSLPTSGIEIGDTYKVLTSITIPAASSQTGAAVTAKAGDLIIATTVAGGWVLVPSGDESNTYIAIASGQNSVNLGTDLKNGNIYVGAAAAKGVDTSLTASTTSTNLPTSAAVVTYVKSATVANATNATNATNDSKGQAITGYIRSLAIDASNGRKINWTKGDNTTGSVTITYNTATTSALGIVKASTAINEVNVGTDGVMEVNEIHISKLNQTNLTDSSKIDLLILDGNFF